MSEKRIKINPDFFSTKNNNIANKSRKKKVKPTPSLKPTAMKKALLKRIQNYQETNKSSEEDKTAETVEFETEFNKSLSFLQELTKKKSKKNKTIKHASNNPEVSLVLPAELREDQLTVATINPSEVTESPIVLENSSKKTPPYGCLKNGQKPTYREWKRATQKVPLGDSKIAVASLPKVISPISTVVTKLPISLREEKLMNIKAEYNKPNLIKRTRTLRYKLGKGKKKVAVLIKDRKTRKKIQHELALLKKQPIIEVKNYLRKHNLLKVGSNAPNDVLRHIYEQAILSGDVTNTAGDTLMHNYMAT